MSDIAPNSAIDPSRCTACDYLLTGLPRQSRCPECGIEFDLDTRARAPVQPPFGFALILAPAFAIPIVLATAYITAEIGGFLLLLALPFFVLCASVYIASELTQWRVSVANYRGSACTTRLLAVLLAGGQFAFFLVSQLALCVASVRICFWVHERLVQLHWLPPVTSSFS